MRNEFRTTRRDPSQLHIRCAIAWLEAAREAGTEHARIAQLASEAYGDAGSLISGVVRDHFPPAVKDQLRGLALYRTACLDSAAESWKDTGRTFATFRRVVAAILHA